MKRMVGEELLRLELGLRVMGWIKELQPTEQPSKLSLQDILRKDVQNVERQK